MWPRRGPDDRAQEQQSSKKTCWGGTPKADASLDTFFVEIERANAAVQHTQKRKKKNRSDPTMELEKLRAEVASLKEQLNAQNKVIFN